VSYRYYRPAIIAALGATWICGHYNPGALVEHEISLLDDVIPDFNDSLARTVIGAYRES